MRLGARVLVHTMDDRVIHGQWISTTEDAEFVTVRFRDGSNAHIPTRNIRWIHEKNATHATVGVD